MAAQPWNVHVLQQSCWRTFRWHRLFFFTSIQKPPSAQDSSVAFPGSQQERGGVEDESSMMYTHGRRFWLAREADWGVGRDHSGAVNKEEIWSTQSDFSQQHCFSRRDIAVQREMWLVSICERKKKIRKKNKLEINNNQGIFIFRITYSGEYTVVYTIFHWL